MSAGRTHSYCIGVKGFHGIPKPELDPLVGDRVFKYKTLTAGISVKVEGKEMG